MHKVVPIIWGFCCIIGGGIFVFYCWFVFQFPLCQWYKEDFIFFVIFESDGTYYKKIFIICKFGIKEFNPFYILGIDFWFEIAPTLVIDIV